MASADEPLRLISAMVGRYARSIAPSAIGSSRATNTCRPIWNGVIVKSVGKFQSRIRVRIAQPLCHRLEASQHRVDAGCGASVDERLR
jgi:hypothetical protein